MEQAIDKELRRLQKAHVTLMRTPTFAFYSGILMLGKAEIDDDIPTACTNGRDVKYGRAFIKTLNDKEDRKSTRLNSSHSQQSRMPSSA